ncbi:MAG: ribonuclease HII [Candidatus Hodarchaeaceae archaeon]|nr:ribonuclease HII [Candidatus Hodarchaeaceae archaeon]
MLGAPIGPVFGPMVLCGAMFEKKALDELKVAGVRDSKLLSPSKREALAKLIAKKALKIEVVELSPAEIDELRLVRKINLNEVEAMNFARILDRLKPEIAYVDSADPDPKMFEGRIRRHMGGKPELVVENFADRKYPAVAAASIVAKVRRDQRVAELRQRYGDFGSGYSSDPRTIRFLERWVREHGELPEFSRRSWETARRVGKQMKQKSCGKAKGTKKCENFHDRGRA